MARDLQISRATDAEIKLTWKNRTETAFQKIKRTDFRNSLLRFSWLASKSPPPLAFKQTDGLVAEWLRRGLQILAPRFDSGRGLHFFLPT